MEACCVVVWVLVLVVLVIYIFAVFAQVIVCSPCLWPCLSMLSILVQGFFGDMTSEDIGVPCPNNREDCVESWFGTVTLSMLTLLQIMTLDSWVCHAGVIMQ